MKFRVIDFIANNLILFFEGTCPQQGLPNMDYAALNSVNLLQPLKVHICMWIYLGISILWFISSITLITSKSYGMYAYRMNR